MSEKAFFVAIAGNTLGFNKYFNWGKMEEAYRKAIEAFLQLKGVRYYIKSDFNMFCCDSVMFCNTI